MDLYDKQILKLMQENSRTTSEEIGYQVGLSATACQRRLKKLRESGTIRKEVAILDDINCGNYVTVVVEVTLKQGSAENIDNFKNNMLKQAEVQQCYYVTGNSDFILMITIKNMLEYEKLTRKLFFDKPYIQKFQSTVVMDKVKVGLNIPLDE
jgi:DNA-binding Lrp family transcriptional regulator